jgi:GMP synthase (glutamine-hydrolysing)
MPDILIIQNTEIERIGSLGDLLKTDGFSTKTVLAKKTNIPDAKYQVIIILGAPESANDDLPYLKKELDIIRSAVKKNIPLLGICLGSQLIAKAFGARVYKGPKKEIGFYKDIEFDNADQTNLFNGINSPATVFHWHGDTFDLPDTAIRLAHSKNYKNQVIKIGSAVGIQFHLEVDESAIMLWLEKSKEELGRIPYVDQNLIEKQIPHNIEIVKNNLELFYKNFKSEFNL